MSNSVDYDEVGRWAVDSAIGDKYDYGRDLPDGVALKMYAEASEAAKAGESEEYAADFAAQAAVAALENMASETDA